MSNCLEYIDWVLFGDDEDDGDDDKDVVEKYPNDPGTTVYNSFGEVIHHIPEEKE